MKKILSVLLCLILLISCTACGSGKFDPDKPVTITILCEDFWADVAGESLQDIVSYYYPSISLEFVTLTDSDQNEREMQLTNIRTEIMAGKGPDIFICNTWQPECIEEDRKEPLFRDPVKAMQNGTFLDLDPYIAASEIMNIGGVTERIMEAGRTERGLMLLPLFYEFELFFLDRSLVADPDKEYKSWDDILLNGEDNVKKTLAGRSFLWSYKAFSDIVDYENYTPAISQQELLDMAVNIQELWKTEGEEIGYYQYEVDGVVYRNTEGLTEMTLSDLNYDKDYIYPLLLPNDKDGVTAFVRTFTAINNNTEHPEAAFKVLETLYSKEVQQSKGIMNENTGKWAGRVCMYMDAFDIPYGIPACEYALDIGIYDMEMLKSFNDRITSVRFISDVDMLLYNTLDSLTTRMQYDNEDVDIEAVIEECYSDLKMMAAE